MQNLTLTGCQLSTRRPPVGKARDIVMNGSISVRESVYM